MRYSSGRQIGPILLTLTLGLAGVALLPNPVTRGDGGAAGNSAQVVGADNCQSCHQAAFTAWENSPHYETEEVLSSDQADEIATKYDPDLLPDEEGSTCLSCHITVNAEEDTTGVSCESCHGAARGYLDQHSIIKKGGRKVQPHAEEPANAAARIGRSVEQFGMVSSTRYNRKAFVMIADNCLSCHTVGEEKLVNVAGHPAGSPFELVSWSQGVIRHNFHRASKNKARSSPTPDAENVPSSAADLRLFYIVGRALDLEKGLRGLAGATAAGTYATAMTQRIAGATKSLRAIQAASPTPEIEQMLGALDGADLGPGNQDLSRRAGRVRASVEAFLEQHDGSKLDKIDDQIPKTFKGKPHAD